MLPSLSGRGGRWAGTVGKQSYVEVSEKRVEQLGQLGLIEILRLRDPEFECCVLSLGHSLVNSAVGEQDDVAARGRRVHHRPAGHLLQRDTTGPFGVKFTS